MNIRVQEYVRREKYYFIETVRKNKYLGVSYDKGIKMFILQFFEYDPRVIGELKPDIYKRYTVSLADMKVFLSSMSIIWKHNTNMIYNVKYNLLEKIDIKKLLTCECLAIMFTSFNDSLNESFKMMLNREQCRDLYAVVKHIMAENYLQ